MSSSRLAWPQDRRLFRKPRGLGRLAPLALALAAVLVLGLLGFAVPA
jgi:hypothetical protein